MSDIERKTLDNILAVARTEFLDKGFSKASLRNIVKKAGVTTGAFYGYFKNKEELFDTLVKESADEFTAMFSGSQVNFANLSIQEKKDLMLDYSRGNMEELIEYMYKHFDSFKLIYSCSEGTKYATYIDELIDIEARYTTIFIKELKKENPTIADVDSNLMHILIGAFLNGTIEVIRHDMKESDAKEYVAKLFSFYGAGWKELFLLE